MEKRDIDIMTRESKCPTVSVISPVFNCEKYLDQFIESILSQTLKDWELILVDDGSTDSSVEILQGYSENDNRINYIRAEHKNAGNARNIGLEVAHGTYVCFLDSDDYCKPNMLERMVLAAQEKNADIVLCQSEYYSEKTCKTAPMSWSLVKSKIPRTNNGCYSKKDCPGFLFQTTIISPWNKLIARELLEKYQIRAQSQIAANDVVLSCMALTCAERIYPLFESLYVQRRDNVNSITGNLSTDEKHRCGYTSSLGLQQELKRVGYYENVQKTYQRLAIHNCIWYFLKNVKNLPLLREDFEFLHEEGFKELDLLEVASSITAENSEDMKVFLEIRDGSLYQFLFDQISVSDKNASTWKKKAQKAAQDMKKLRNSRTYRAGDILLAVPKRIKRIYNWSKTVKPLNPIKNWKDKNRYEQAPKRIAFLAFEKFHYDVLANIMQICNIEKNYIIAYVDSMAKTEADTMLGDLSNLVEWHTFKTPNLRKKVNKATTWAEYRNLFVEEIIARDNLDYVILPSPEYHPDWYLPLVEKQGRSYKVIAGAHNLNTVFFSKGENPEIDNFYSIADEYCVIDSVLKDTLCKGNVTKKIHLFPRIFTPLPEKKLPGDGERITFVVTGNVEESRKDYQTVVEALSKIPEFHPKIRLVLLGRANNDYALKIITQLKNMEATGLETISYSQYIPQEEFDKTMFESQCMIAPVVKETAFKGIIEYYGSTKLSGVVNDMIKFACPAIVVDGVEIPEELQNSICRYDSADSLGKAISKFLDIDVLAKYNAKAKLNSEKYLLENYLWE